MITIAVPNFPRNASNAPSNEVNFISQRNVDDREGLNSLILL